MVESTLMNAVASVMTGLLGSFNILRKAPNEVSVHAARNASRMIMDFLIDTFDGFTIFTLIGCATIQHKISLSVQRMCTDV